MIIDEIFKFRENDSIVVGCSTGPDSMALLDMLLKVRDKYNLQIIVAHVNHNLRKQSIEEEEFIKDYCKKKNIMIEAMTIDKYGDDNFHNEARNIRYNFFEKVINKYGANYLMTAHHGDDLIETILMRITRGSNLSGYSGFHKIVEMENYKIVRPLIYFTKDELEEYDKKNNVPYYIDDSNMKDKYTRNRYRKNVLPFLKEEEKSVHRKFLKFSESIEEASKYIDKARDEALNHVLDKKTNHINIAKFLELDSYIQKEILYYVMEEYYQDDLILVNDRHIELLTYLITNKKANLSVNLPNEVEAVKSYNEFYLRRQTGEVTTYEIEFDNYVELPNSHSIKMIDKTDDNSNNICRLSSEDIKLPIIVRTRKLGDKISVKGMNGKKKVKDIFIESKIDKSKRDIWPIVVDSMDNILWIPGLKKSKFDKPKSEKCDIILKYQ